MIPKTIARLPLEKLCSSKLNLNSIQPAAIIVTKRNYASDVEVSFVSENPLTAALKKGTGGRSSFNGSVVTIFGANGFLGTSLVHRLGKIGSQVIIPYRGDPHNVRKLKLAGDLGQILFLPFYLRDEESIYQSMKYSNVVINLMGRKNATPSFTLDELHVEGAARIAKIARESGVKRLIHVSALNCSPNPKPIMIKNGSQFYRTKYYGELAVREHFPDAVIFRPADIFGFNDYFFSNYTYKWKRGFKGDYYLLNKGKGIYKQPVYVADVADGIIASINDSRSTGSTYDAVGPRRYELSDLLEFFNVYLERDVHHQQTIKDLRWHKFWVIPKTILTQTVKKDPQMSMELLETEHTSDQMTGNPTLRDLGIPLSNIEPHARPNLYWRRYWSSIDTPLHEQMVPDQPRYTTY